MTRLALISVYDRTLQFIRLPRGAETIPQRYNVAFYVKRRTRKKTLSVVKDVAVQAKVSPPLLKINENALSPIEILKLKHIRCDSVGLK